MNVVTFKYYFIDGKSRSFGDFKAKRSKIHVGGVESAARLIKHRFAPVEVTREFLE